MTPAQLSMLQTIVGHLYAAKVQRSPKDDRIIAEHIDTAHEAAVVLLHTMEAAHA